MGSDEEEVQSPKQKKSRAARQSAQVAKLREELEKEVTV